MKRSDLYLEMIKFIATKRIVGLKSWLLARRNVIVLRMDSNSLLISFWEWLLGL